MPNFVFIATSVDGYIATPDGGIDWLHEIPNPTSNDYGYAKFMEGIDALVMGRNSFEKVLSFGGDWHYTKKVFVLSNSLKEVPTLLKDKVEIINGDLKVLVKQFNTKGYNNLYIDGGKTIQGFLKEDLIDELTLNQIPIILGSGIPLFNDEGNTLRLEHCDTLVYEGGLVKTHYKKKCGMAR
jgi:dihydrofolate reductase